MTDMNFTSGMLEYRIHGEIFGKHIVPGENLRWDHGHITWRNEKVSGGLRLRAFCELAENVELFRAFIGAIRDYAEDERIFCNGFQSWTTSREYSPEERIPNLSPLGRLFGLDRFGDYHFIGNFRKSASLYSHSWTYIRKDATLTLLGSAAEHQGYTFFLHNPRSRRCLVARDCEGVIRRHMYPLFDLFIASGVEEEVFDSYSALLGLSGKRKTVTGWTSWYNYYTGITEEIVLKNLNAFAVAEVPAGVFQIDDGYQTAVGDWLSLKDVFPRGMKFLADRIRTAGYRPGIWLAPFVCTRGSALRKEHPEWVLTDSRGVQVKAGWNPGWDGNFFALDIYHEGFREYLREVFSTVTSEWGYEVLKLDFLYAAGMLPRLGKSRGEVMAEGVRFLADLAGGADILGCGVPLGSCSGVFSWCRIGSDAALKWEDRFLAFLCYRERVSTLNCLTSTLGRRHLAGRAFLNDPDVFILREGVKMNRNQRETLFLLNVLFGDILFTSDDISEYSPETLVLFRSLFPVRERKIVGFENDGLLRFVDFTVNTAVYRACVNLGDTPVEVSLPKGPWVRQGTAWHDSGPDTVGRIELPPRATRCFQRLEDGFPCIAGGSGHLFPAAFVESLEREGRDITLTFSPDSSAALKVRIMLDQDGRYRVNGVLREAELSASGVPFIQCGR